MDSDGDEVWLVDFRRCTFASCLVMKGVPLKAIQELLGHSSIRTTMVYSHLAKGMLSDAVAVLDEPPVAQKAEPTDHADAV